MLLLRAVLALALVLAQTGALIHLLGHAAEVPQASTTSAKIASDDRAPLDAFGACLQCLAIGGLDLPLGAGGSACDAGPHAVAQPAYALPLPPPSAPALPRCRAPPALA